MNRGVEIDPRVADAADALIETQVRAGLVDADGGPLRPADERPGRGQGGAADGGGVMLCRQDCAGEEPDRPRRAGPRSRGKGRRRPRRPDRRRHDRGARLAPRHERAPRRRGDGPRARAGVRRPARPPAHARPRGRGDDRLRDAGRGSRRLLRDPRHAEHRSGRRLGRRARRRSSRRRRREAEIPVGFLAAITQGPGGRRADGDGRARRRGRRRLHATTAGRWRRRASCAARSSTAPSRAGRSRSTARSRRSRAAGRCTRARSRPSSASRGYPSVAESLMVERDLSLAAYEERPAAPPPPLGARVGRGAARGARRPASRRPPRSRRTTSA